VCPLDTGVACKLGTLKITITDPTTPQVMVECGAPTPPSLGLRLTPEDLATLRAQLTRAIAEVDKVEARVTEQLDSVEKIEALEHKLRDALHELSRQKDVLRQKG